MSDFRKRLEELEKKLREEAGLPWGKIYDCLAEMHRMMSGGEPCHGVILPECFDIERQIVETLGTREEFVERKKNETKLK